MSDKDLAAQTFRDLFSVLDKLTQEQEENGEPFVPECNIKWSPDCENCPDYAKCGGIL
jgi:hypothetical protein